MTTIIVLIDDTAGYKEFNYSWAVGEHGDWDTGWVDGHADIGWSKKEKKSRKEKPECNT